MADYETTFHFVTCNKYRVLKSKWCRLSDTPYICGHLEDEQADGYAVLAQQESKIVAGSDGVYDLAPRSPSYDIERGIPGRCE